MICRTLWSARPQLERLKLGQTRRCPTARRWRSTLLRQNVKFCPLVLAVFSPSSFFAANLSCSMQDRRSPKFFFIAGCSCISVPYPCLPLKHVGTLGLPMILTWTSLGCAPTYRFGCNGFRCTCGLPPSLPFRRHVHGTAASSLKWCHFISSSDSFPPAMNTEVVITVVFRRLCARRST